MSTCAPVQNHEPAEEGKQGEEEKEKEKEKEEMKEPQSEERAEEKTEKEQKKEEKKEPGKKEKGKEDELQGSWKDFFYNPRTGEVLGRTASSWGLILLFYFIFYGFLAGMFSLTIWVMLQTLDENVPRHQDRVADPGLVIRPHATEITYNRTDPLNYQQYIQQLHDLLQQYNDSIQERNDLCLVGEYTDQDQEQGSIKKVCQFKRSILRQCSGLPDTSFGYAEGKPCIIVKMNRVRTLYCNQHKLLLSELYRNP
ncbi:Sodium/potassium-transporting ATPase subunit beta-3 [Oryzias melastigma]|uniref:Sodium/potassium-transporting ATPase subunit beta n=1 Tax=Oryzias melastigma TaxID=30732 RepID=A0A834BQI3_ORYME|nr:Sodium/potassium-transporting ATPase subunit beta-3 [Oryzias melastigma]